MQLLRSVGMTLNQWEAVLEIIAATDEPENWNLSESIKDQIYSKGSTYEPSYYT